MLLIDRRNDIALARLFECPFEQRECIIEEFFFGLHSRFAHDQTNLPYRRLLMLA